MKILRKLFPSSFRRALRAKFDSIFTDPRYKIERIGNGGAAWWICSELIDRESIVISGGVGNDVSFEKELAIRYSCRVHLFDPSPTGVATMAKSENQLPGMKFRSVGLAGKSGAVEFGAPENREEGSFRLKAETGGESLRFECVRLSELTREMPNLKTGILKLDIEGFEYDVLEDILAQKLYFRQICVEFHHFMPGVSLRKTLTALLKLRKNGYKIVHKSQCDYLFVRK